MKTNNSNIIICCIFLTTVVLTSCRNNEKVKSQISKGTPEFQQNSSETPSNIFASRPDGKSDMIIDRKDAYQSGLKQYGIDDFSTRHLIDLMDSNIPSVRLFSAYLLGERKETSAIPRLEKALVEESFPIQRAVTQALLKMGNRKGVPVMLDVVKKAEKEIEQGDFRNLSDQLHVLEALAFGGEVSAIPYLRKMLGYQQSFARGGAVTALGMLYEKAPSVLADVESMQNDEDPLVRTLTSYSLAIIKSKKNK